MTAPYKISLPDGTFFSANADENLLVAAQRAHWLVRYGCRNGNCDACAATLLQGRVHERDAIVEAIGETSAAQKILLCLCRAATDLHIALPDSPQHGSAEQARRCYAQLQRSAQTDTGRTLHFTLPAGKPLPMYAGQYALIEYGATLLRAEIDTLASNNRDIVLHTCAKFSGAERAYFHLRYPLGYCYAANTHVNALILYSEQQRRQALLLQQALPNAIAVEFAQLSSLPAHKAYAVVLACADDETQAQLAYEELLRRAIAFSEFRSDAALRYRWRVLRQDDNGNRFVIAEGLEEKAARTQASEFEQRGHKQLYWAEAMS